jgi:gamma-glutamyl:cysteine ligase YbdK (ATP-grasp superfamily)
MGQEIARSQFTPHDFRVFTRRLEQETRLLGRWFREGRFPELPYMGGMEVEAWLVDADYAPAPMNRLFIERLGDPLVVPELAKFNFELNTAPRLLRGDALPRMERSLQMTWDQCARMASALGARAIMIGILPTVRHEQLCIANMSDQQRYRALNEQVLRQRRGRPMQLDIAGRDVLCVTHTDVMLESATTSFQIHLRVPPSASARFYNASVIASAPMVAVSANSPYLFGRDLWDETRIPLFEQSVASPARKGCGAIGGRVTFGRTYVGESLMECFDENARCFPSLLPMELDKYPASLSHVRLHNGTIWRWNRPLVGFEEGGEPHLRIEHRSCPAGPTVVDSVANAAFYYGLVTALARQSLPPEATLDFEQARANFYAAARDGLQASIVWLDGERYLLRELVQDELLPWARHALLDLQLVKDDIDHYLGIIRERVETRLTGAEWQRAWVGRHGHDMGGLVRAYAAWQGTERPVHRWPI